MRVLIAEDDPISRTVLRKTLERWGHDVFAAPDGEQAWAAFQDTTFPVVISDWMMPGLDGLELVRRIRHHGQNGYVYTILLTARSQKEDIVEGMEAGADDFVTKPFDAGELHARLRAGERILSLEHTLASRNRQLEAANDRMQRDLEAAAQIQKSLLPQSLPEVSGLDLAWAFRPCDELAGDILNILRLDETHLAFYVLDVSNHGVPAALLAVTLSRLLTPLMFQSHLLKEPCVDDSKGYRIVPPCEVGRQLNRQFPMDPVNGQYFTLLYAVLDLATGELRYVQAGHPSPVLLKGSIRKAAVLEGSGLPIGFVESTTYSEWRQRLSVNDRLYLYSDGVPEACNPAGEQFGEARFLEAIESSASVPLKESLALIEQRLGDWCGEAGLRDDVSLLALEIQQP
jgi:sigma-B regulation protein RsbU (phosphoserine phosphatase)